MRTLLRHEFRVLVQNRLACVVILLTLVVAGLTRLRSEDDIGKSGPTCYIVYWQEDEWVGQLKKSLAASKDPQQPSIEIVPVDRFTGPDGYIRYPLGSHSIQLGPAEPTPDGHNKRSIWYWYDGADPSVLWPYTRWFWKETREYFGDGTHWQEKVSPLKPELVIAGTKATLPRVGSPTASFVAEVGLVWLLLFYVGCHLPTLSLAESRGDRTIHSLVLTPSGWHEVAAAKLLFYLTLTTALLATLAAITQPSALLAPSFWLTTIAATFLYLGVAFTIGSWCSSVVSASAGIVVYLLISGLVYGATSALPAPYAAFSQWSFAEGSILRSYRNIWHPQQEYSSHWALLSVVLWAVIWQILAHLSYRRLSRQ